MTDTPRPQASREPVREPARAKAPRARAYAPDPAAAGRPCEKPGCPEPGGFRAPKSRTTLNQYWWFCLDHVREHNAAWDFYKGMSPAEIEAQTRSDTGWQRPTWPLGRLGAHVLDEATLRDPLYAMSAGRTRGARPAPPRATIPADLRDQMQALGLEWPVSMATLKSRYKELAKRHHPDANGGDRASEERLKTINLAYAAVRQHLTAEPRMAAAG